MEKRTCIECGEAFQGRADKKFCSDLCRNSHNNKLNSDSTNYVRNINNILRRNRRIIEDLLPKDSQPLPILKQKLTDKGFNFTYLTNTLITKDGKKYHFCYEYGYLVEEGKYCLLVKRDQES